MLLLVEQLQLHPVLIQCAWEARTLLRLDVVLDVLATELQAVQVLLLWVVPATQQAVQPLASMLEM
jgi:hypothetical protein